MAIKKIGVSTDYCSYDDELKPLHVVAQGWNSYGDLTCMTDRRCFGEFAGMLSDIEGGYKPFCNFLNGMWNFAPGEIVLAYEGTTLRGIAELPPRFMYEFSERLEDYKNTLYPVVWVDWHDFCPKLSGRLARGVSGIENCSNPQDIVRYIKANWERYKAEHGIEIQSLECEAHLAELEASYDSRFAASLKNLNRMKDKQKTESDIQADAELLRNVKNLVFTGAPGTGKTYRAREIAKRLVKGKAEPALERLRRVIADLDPSSSEMMQKEAEYNRLLADFNRKFPASSLAGITKEQYCIGDPAYPRQSFCWWIERGLKPLGYYFPGSSTSYLMYYKKKIEAYSYHGQARRWIEENSSLSADDIMARIGSALGNLVMNKSVEPIFGESFQLKVLNSYYPDEFFPVNSRTHLIHVVQMFSLAADPENMPTRELNRLCVDLYQREGKGKGLSVFQFGDVLYRNFNVKGGEHLTADNTDILMDGAYEVVQFHQSYDYTDFVEGLRPYENEDGNIGFRRVDGVFKAFCRQAVENPGKNYVFIIDEINRGETSKIFGELFAALDPDYRGNKMPVRTQYQNLIDESDDDCFSSGFYVPENVFIIGTMNDIDRNVESIDFAMRRRFTWKEIDAESSKQILSVLPSDLEEAASAKMDAVNKVIGERLGKDYQIGAAYFLKLKTYADRGVDEAFRLLWRYHLANLIAEYLRGMPDAAEAFAEIEAAYKA